MNALDLKTLDLGPFDADDDHNMLQYFVPFSFFDALINKNIFFVVGVKGSGKSAIKQYLLNKRKVDKEFVIPIDDTYSIPISELETSSPAEIKNKMKGYITGGIIQFLLDSNEVPEESKKILKGLEDKVPIIKKILSSTTIKPPYVEVALDGFLSGDKPKGLRMINDPTTSKAIINSLEDEDIWILIDDIHRVFTSDDQELSLKFIEGLIYATSDLVIRTFKKQVFIVLFLRSEIYEELILKATEIDKELQYIWQIIWDVDELKRFLAKRIQWALNAKEDQDDWRYWKMIFDTAYKKETISLQEYVIDRLINGPRDLLLLVDLARQIAIRAGAKKINLEHIMESEFEYGEEKLNQINRNFQNTYNGIKLVLEFLFRKKKQVYNRTELEAHIKDNLLTNLEARKVFEDLKWIRSSTPFSFIQILYRVGFIGYWDQDVERYIHVLENAKPDRTLVQNPKLRIHNAFTRYLELNSS